MGTYAEDLSPGVLVECYECFSPVRNTVYRHQCDIIRTGSPSYCFSCMAARGICKKCKHYYAQLFDSHTSYPLRTNYHAK